MVQQSPEIRHGYPCSCGATEERRDPAMQNRWCCSDCGALATDQDAEHEHQHLDVPQGMRDLLDAAAARMREAVADEKAGFYQRLALEIAKTWNDVLVWEVALETARSAVHPLAINGEHESIGTSVIEALTHRRTTQGLGLADQMISELADRASRVVEGYTSLANAYGRIDGVARRIVAAWDRGEISGDLIEELKGAMHGWPREHRGGEPYRGIPAASAYEQYASKVEPKEGA